MADKLQKFTRVAGQTYYATQKELAAASWRAAERARLKAEFQKKYTHPMKNSYEGGYILDPAVQRFMSMKVSTYEHWKPTTKNTWAFLWGTVIPVLIIWKYLNYEHEHREEMYGNGIVPYTERHWKNG